MRLREVEGDASLPGRLLLIGLPLTIALGAVVAHLLFPAAGWAAIGTSHGKLRIG